MKTRVQAVLAILCLAFVLQACDRLSGPGAAVKDFYHAIDKGDLDRALDLLSAQVLAMGRDKIKAGLAEATRRTQAKGGIKTTDIQEEKVVGDTATLKAVVHYGNGTAETENVKLVREEGKWKLVPSKN